MSSTLQDSQSVNATQSNTNDVYTPLTNNTVFDDGECQYYKSADYTIHRRCDVRPGVGNPGAARSRRHRSPPLARTVSGYGSGRVARGCLQYHVGKLIRHDLSAGCGGTADAHCGYISPNPNSGNAESSVKTSNVPEFTAIHCAACLGPEFTTQSVDSGTATKKWLWT